MSKFIFVGFFLAILILVGYGFYSKIKEKKAIFSLNYHEEKELFVINAPSFFKKSGISVSLLQLKNSDIHYLLGFPPVYPFTNQTVNHSIRLLNNYFSNASRT